MFDRFLDAVLRVAAVLLVAAMLVLVCATVALRATGVILFGSDELTRLLLSWTVAIGAVLAAREGGHLAVEAVTARLSGRVRGVVAVVSSFAVIVFLAVLAWTGTSYAVLGFQSSALTPGLGISPGWAPLAWPVAALLMLVTAVRELVARARAVVHGDPTPAHDDDITATA